MRRMVQDPTGAHAYRSQQLTLNASPCCEKLRERTSRRNHGEGANRTGRRKQVRTVLSRCQSRWNHLLSGQIDVEAGDDVKAQTQGALDKIDALLDAAQLSKHNLCFAQVLLADINDFAAMNEVYGAWVEDIEVRPARAAFAAAALPAGALVEIVVQGACRTSF